MRPKVFANKAADAIDAANAADDSNTNIDETETTKVEVADNEPSVNNEI